MNQASRGEFLIGGHETRRWTGEEIKEAQRAEVVDDAALYFSYTPRNPARDAIDAGIAADPAVSITERLPE